MTSIFKTAFWFVVIASLGILTDGGRFSELVESKAYVDKSLLLKHLFDHSVLLVTAPRRFMKTTNLKLVKAFLSIEVNDAGKEKKPMSNKNHKLFKDLEIYTKERELFVQNFGQYPVVHLDLRCEYFVTSFRDAKEILRNKIHECFLEHRYLRGSSKLNEKEKEMIIRWCDPIEYKKMNDQLLRHGLEKLTHFLFKHFDKEVYVLVDDYDSIITQAMYGVIDDKEFEDVLNLVCDQIAMVLQTNDCVKGGFITGVTHIAESHFSQIPNSSLFKFLDHHKLKEFYGLTEKEVDSLFEHCKLSHKREEARIWYGGYTCSLNTTLYNPYSILNLVKFNQVKSYWAQSGSVNQFSKLMRNHEIRNEMETLLQGNVSWIQFQFHFDLPDLLTIRNSYLGTKEMSSNYHVIFSNFLELGYLSYLPGPLRNNTIGVLIPNREVGEYFVEKCKEYYIQVYKVDKESLENVDYTNIHKWLVDFYKVNNDAQEDPEMI